MWASLGSGCEAAAAHGRKLLGLWLFLCPRLPNASSFSRWEGFVEVLVVPGMIRSCCCCTFPLPGAPCNAVLLAQDSPGRAVLGRSWKGCYRAAAGSTQKHCLVPAVDFCSFFLCVHQPFCLDGCRVSPCSLLQSQLRWDMDLRLATLFHRD